MRLCHPIDMRYDRVGSGLLLQATCCAPSCGRMYARLTSTKLRTWAASQYFATVDDWASLLSMRQVFDEMRCQADQFCASCAAGHLLTDCAGVATA